MRRPTDPDVLLLRALADPARLGIVRELSAGDGVCACDFTSCCGSLAQPTVSHHLKVLREAGWVRAEHRGANVSYSLCAEAVERFRALAAELAPGAKRPAGELSLPVIRVLNQ